jgi:predicted DNA-binding antitoxin AbrB/MazE fold protein
MQTTIQAIYEKGVLRPLVPLELAENEAVTIEVLRRHRDWLDDEIVEAYTPEADDSISLEDVRTALATINGSLDQAIDDCRGEY